MGEMVCREGEVRGLRDMFIEQFFHKPMHYFWWYLQINWNTKNNHWWLYGHRKVCVIPLKGEIFVRVENIYHHFLWWTRWLLAGILPGDPLRKFRRQNVLWCWWKLLDLTYFTVCFFVVVYLFDCFVDIPRCSQGLLLVLFSGVIPGRLLGEGGV